MSKRWLGLLLFAIWIGGAGVARAAITPSDDPLQFGNVVVGQAPTLDDTLSADSNTNNVTVAIHGGGGCNDYSIAAPSGSFNLSPTRTQLVRVQFSPSSPGEKDCVIDIKVNNTIARSFNVTGTGQAPAIHVDQLPTFTPTEVGKSSTAQLKLTNNGTSQLNIASATLSASSDFSVSGVPSTLAAGAQATLTITCTPSTFGDRTDTLAIASDAFM
ncbi:MAG TPA: choice-of-anchor D domain-containing protein, partial [Kofleriaceae bacterium]|nr:choice-of-anchor D domain-containing protein [Kofleriaceae bacterium]